MKHPFFTPSLGFMLAVGMALPVAALAVDPVAVYQPVTKPRLDPANAELQAQTPLSRGNTNIIVNSVKSGNTQQAATRVATNRATNAASSELAKSTGLGKGNANALVNSVKNGNTQQAVTRVATNRATNAASSELAKNTSLGKGNANAIVNGVKNGNIQQTGTNIAVREGQSKATSALTKSGNLSNRDAGAITGAGAALAKGATNLAVNAGTQKATQELSKATGIPGGLAGGLVKGVLGGSKGSGSANVNFKQKNDYVAASDDGSIGGSNGGSGGGGQGNLSQDLAKLGFGAANKLFAGQDGIIRTAAGEVAGRIDTKTGKLFDAAGKEIASNTLTAMRMKESMALNKPSQASTPPAATDNSGIPAGFGNSNWSEAQRKLEWAKLPFAQQSAWMKEAAVKAAAANANQKISAVNNPDPRTEPRS